MKVKVKLGLRGLSKRAAFANRSFGTCSAQFSNRLRVRQRALHSRESQPDLFEIFFGLKAGKVTLEQAPVARKRKVKRRRRAKDASGKKKGALIPLVGQTRNLKLVVRKTDRKIAFRTKSPQEVPGTDEFMGVSDDGLRRLHYVLLVASLRTLKEHVEIGSPRAAEVWAWIEREGQEEPFAFDTCVLIAAELSVDPSFRDPFPDTWEEDEGGRLIHYRRRVDVDFAGATPEGLREALRETLRRGYPNGIPNHADVCARMLMRADLGDPEALEWITGQSTIAPSFAECCDALGFEMADSGQPTGDSDAKPAKGRVLEVA